MTGEMGGKDLKKKYWKSQNTLKKKHGRFFDSQAKI